MKKYKLRYYYMVQGMEWAQEFGPTIIEAEDKDEALYKFHKENGMNFTSLKAFRKKAEHIKNWATSCKEIKGYEK